MSDLLFHEYPLHAVLSGQLEKMKAYARDLPAERVNAASDDELVAHVVAEYRIEPLTAYLDRAEAEHAETELDPSGRYDPDLCDRRRARFVKANQITVNIPFTGDPELWKCSPSTYTLNPPRATVRPAARNLPGTVSMSLALPADMDETEFNRWIKEQTESIRQHVEWSHRDVEQFNEQLERHAREAITCRRQQLEKQGGLLKKLVIPLKPRNGAPTPSPIPMPKRVVKPLPAPRQVEQEYGISDEHYGYILRILRHESRSFEATPDAFLKLDEEELRDVVLAHLNGHFEGGAAGERFRKKGKTDICIEYENRAAFVAECKLWKGSKALGEAIDQLLGYLTWRDTKAALLVWNKTVKDFTKLQESIPGLLQQHPRYVRSDNSGAAGEWRAVFRAIGDDGRETTVQVFLVDLAAR